MVLSPSSASTYDDTTARSTNRCSGAGGADSSSLRSRQVHAAKPKNAIDHNWAGVWLGATLAMVLADGLAIAVGALLHRRLPERLLHGLASVLFLLFGLWLLFDAALGWRWLAVVVTASAATVAAIIAIVVPLRSRLAARRAAK